MHKAHHHYHLSAFLILAYFTPKILNLSIHLYCIQILCKLCFTVFLKGGGRIFFCKTTENSTLEHNTSHITWLYICEWFSCCCDVTFLQKKKIGYKNNGRRMDSEWLCLWNELYRRAMKHFFCVSAFLHSTLTLFDAQHKRA